MCVSNFCNCCCWPLLPLAVYPGFKEERGDTPMYSNFFSEENDLYCTTPISERKHARTRPDEEQVQNQFANLNFQTYIREAKFCNFELSCVSS